MRTNQDTLAWARELAHPFSTAFALCGATWLHQFRRERDPTREHAEALMALATEHEFALMSAWAATLRGWALTALESEEGIAHICQGLAAAQATGAAVQRSNCLALLAEAFGDTRQIAEGLAALEQALAQVHGTGESWWKAELHRLRGELLLRHDVAAEQEAETCFRQAIDIASRQHAKSLELRATTSLSRLFQRQGKREDARRMLAEIYGWFTEGFDTADLREAKVLLDNLSRG